MQEANSHRLNTMISDLISNILSIVLIKLNMNIAVKGHSLLDFKPQVPRYKRWGFFVL